MTTATLVWRNLARNRTRTVLTIASLAISLFLYTLLSATVDSMTSVAASSAERLRLVVHHKTTMTQLLPLGYARRIGSLSAARAVCGMRWFGGHVPNNQTEFPSLAVDPKSFPVVFDDIAISPPELASWDADRTAAVVGSGLAKRMGWSMGDRVTLRSGVPPFLALEFRIVGITRAPAYPNLFVLRLDYLNDSFRADATMPADHNDAVNFYWVKTTSPAQLESLRGEIDAAFAHSPDPTMTELEESFVTQFTRMFGDIPRIVRGIGLIVIVSILIVVAHTMSMSFNDRVGELAVLKAIGFDAKRIFLELVAEAMLVGLVGGLIGCIPALCLFGLSEAGLSIPYFPVISVSPAIALAGVATGLVIGLLAAALPARRVARLSVTETLRAIA